MHIILMLSLFSYFDTSSWSVSWLISQSFSFFHLKMGSNGVKQGQTGSNRVKWGQRGSNRTKLGQLSIIFIPCPLLPIFCPLSFYPLSNIHYQYHHKRKQVKRDKTGSNGVKRGQKESNRVKKGQMRSNRVKRGVV